MYDYLKIIKTNMAENVGRVLFVNCSSFLSSKDVISGMLTSDVPDPKQLSDTLYAYPWRIENKYYSADTHLCTCAVSSLPHQCEFAVNVHFQSVIIIFDQNEVSSFKEATTWLPFVESQNPSVLLLLNSGQGSGKGVSQEEVVKWCLDNSFEFVNMISVEDEEEDVDEFPTKKGIDRIIEALQCAEWPNMEMREYRPGRRLVLNSKMNDGDLSSAVENGMPIEERQRIENTSSTATDAFVEAPKEGRTLCTDELELLSSLADDGAENESFEELFQKLATMKERAASLPADERKDYAEKIAMAFWRAMGGSEEEISSSTGEAE